MKKINVFVVVLIFLFAISSCTKNEVKIENDIESCEKLCGTWSQTTLTEISLGNDATDLDYVIGFASYKSYKTINFDMKQNMQTKIDNELVSYEAETEVGELSQEELDLYFNQNMIIDAKFIASDKNLQYENSRISMNGSEFISYDEYMTMNPQAEEKKQTLSWKIIDDKLILTLHIGKESYETVFTKVSPEK